MAASSPGVRTPVMLGIVGTTALISTLVLLWAAATNWSGDFRAARGALLGCGLAIVPATVIGLNMALSTEGELATRAVKGLGLLMVAPIFGLAVACAVTVTGEDHELRDQGSFFASFGALVIGLGAAVLWTAVALAKASSLIPSAIAGLLATTGCVAVGVPMVVALPLLLTRNNGKIYNRWLESTDKDDDGAHDGRPPFAVALTIAVPYVALLAMVVPFAKAARLARPLTAVSDAGDSKHVALFKALGYGAKPLRHLQVLSGCCVLAAVPTVLVAAKAPARLAALLLMTSTPLAGLFAAQLSSTQGSTDEIWTQGATYYAFPTLALGTLTLHAAKTSSDRAWWRPASAVAFGACTVIFAALLAVPCLQKRPVEVRLEVVTQVIRFAAAPWWLATLALADAYGVQSVAFWGPVAFVAVAASFKCWIEAFHQAAFTYRRKGPGAYLPARRHVVAVAPHVLLVVSVAYLALNLTLAPTKHGGAGVLLATAFAAPPATYSGIAMLRDEDCANRRTVKGDASVALSVGSALVFLSFLAHVAVKGRASNFFHFDDSVTSEAKAGALWLLVALPASTTCWHLVVQGSRVWARGGARTHLALLSKEWEFYVGLLRRAALDDAQTKADGRDNDSTGNDGPTVLSVLAAIRQGADISTLHGEEAASSFATLACLVLLVPFGVLAPLGFLTKFGALGLSTQVIMTTLGVAVIGGISLFVYACNASMARIKVEERTKLAAFDLRLALRKFRVIASAKCARAICEGRTKHHAHATRVVARERATLEARLKPRDRALAARVADLALREDLLTSAARYSRCKTLAQADIEDARAPESPSSPHSPGTSKTHGSRLKKTFRWGDGGDAESEASSPYAAAMEASARDDDLVFWKEAAGKANQNCMTLVPLSVALADLHHAHEKDLKAVAKQQKKARLQTPKKPTQETKADAFDIDDDDDDNFEEEEEQTPFELPGPIKAVVAVFVEARRRFYAAVAAVIYVATCPCRSVRSAYRACVGVCGKGSKRVAPLRALASSPIVKFSLKGASKKSPRAREATTDAAKRSLDAVVAFAERSGLDTKKELKKLKVEALESAQAANKSSTDPGAMLDELERRLIARARWRSIRDAVPVLVRRSYTLQPASKEATAAYRQTLLPRAFCYYSTNAKNEEHSGGISLTNWERFLDDACILGTAAHQVQTTQAKVIFDSLAKAGIDDYGTPLISYTSFRQAMRQTAILMYPHLPEMDALKLLGQKHVFPNIALASPRQAKMRGLVPSGRCSDARLSDFLSATPSFRVGGGSDSAAAQPTKYSRAFIEEKKRALTGGDSMDATNAKAAMRMKTARTFEPAAGRAGWTYGRALLDAQQHVAEAKRALAQVAEEARLLAEEEAALAAEEDSEDEDSEDEDEDVDADMLKMLLRGEAVDPNSKEAQRVKELQEAADKEQEDGSSSSKGRCGRFSFKGKVFKNVFSLGTTNKAMGEAQMELELLKAAVDADDSKSSRDWDTVADLVVKSVRESEDAFDAAATGDAAPTLKVALNVDNAFALFELVTEFVSFASVGFKGVAAYGWGLERSCDLKARACEAAASSSSKKKSTIALAASAPLMTLKYDASGQFWVVVVVCIATPFYLLEAVQAAREQRIGVNKDGSPLKLFSAGWFYYQSTKVLQATVPPVMTTLVSVLVCDACAPQPQKLSRMGTACASPLHVVQLAASLVATLCYYPIISFIAPQLQFKAKALDLKFEPSYLVVLAQGKLLLAGAVNFLAPERFTRNCITGDVEDRILHSTFSLLVFSASVATFLAVYTHQARPCLVKGFSVVRACTLAAAAAVLWISALAFFARRYVVTKDAARVLAALLLLLVLSVLLGTAGVRLRQLFSNNAPAGSRKIEPSPDDSRRDRDDDDHQLGESGGVTHDPIMPMSARSVESSDSDYANSHHLGLDDDDDDDGDD